MPTRFHVTNTCVNLVDVDPTLRASANKTNIEFQLYGHLVHGEILPDMFANIRPRLRRGKHYRISSVEMIDVNSRIVTHILTILCNGREEFKELVALNIQKEEIELFQDTD